MGRIFENELYFTMIFIQVNLPFNMRKRQNPLRSLCNALLQALLIPKLRVSVKGSFSDFNLLFTTN